MAIVANRVVTVTDLLMTCHNDQESLARAHSLQTSLRSSVDSLQNKYSAWYPDIVLPVIAAITQVLTIVDEC